MTVGGDAVETGTAVTYVITYYCTDCSNNAAAHVTRTVTVQDVTSEDDGAFDTTWDATASPHTISMPLEVHSGGTLSIDWGDNSTGTTTTSNDTISHIYSAPGEYQVSMTANLARITLGDTGSTASKLASIDQWGDIGWSSMEGALLGASNMQYNAADAPDLSGVTNMNLMFESASAFNGDISGWDVSTEGRMSFMFRGASAFNQPLGSWAVSAVTDMSYMFDGASAFNQPLDSWNVSSVENMSFMFRGASAFNQPLDSWNVSSVTRHGIHVRRRLLL